MVGAHGQTQWLDRWQGGHNSNSQVSDHGAVLWDDFAIKNRIVPSMTMYDIVVAVKERNSTKNGRLGGTMVLDKTVEGGRQGVVENYVEVVPQRGYSASLWQARSCCAAVSDSRVTFECFRTCNDSLVKHNFAGASP